MSTIVNTGWLKNNNGEKFAPKTLSSQVITNDGITIENKLSSDLENIESNIDYKLSVVNTSISNITNGSTPVKEAEHATNADNATSATTANSATKAIQDGNGKVISSTYETKDDAQAKLDEAKAYTDAMTSGVATSGVVDNKISTHNSSATAHTDIRDLITELSTKVDNFLDVDDTTTDQLSEVLTLINNNKGTLESLTSGKVNVSDIVDNLTTANANKVLSANQGVVLKGLIDALQEVVDGKAQTVHTHSISDVTNLQTTLDAKAAQTDLDTHIADGVKHITSIERTNWNAAKSHADSTHAPVEAQENVIESIKVNGAAQTITSKSVNITVPTEAADIGAAPATHGHAISDITDLQTTLNNAASAIGANTSSIGAHNDRISDLEAKVGDGFEEITSTEIQNLFK